MVFATDTTYLDDDREQVNRSPWFKSLVNEHQTSEERRAKYWLAISLGANNSLARRMRDWRISKIERRFNLSDRPETGWKTVMPTIRR